MPSRRRKPPLRPSIAGLMLAIGLASLTGCSRGGAAPTTIYEGGGTIPEIVDQPEKPESKPGKKVRR